MASYLWHANLKKEARTETDLYQTASAWAEGSTCSRPVAKRNRGTAVLAPDLRCPA